MFTFVDLEQKVHPLTNIFYSICIYLAFSNKFGTIIALLCCYYVLFYSLTTKYGSFSAT